jgi:hypothetical protein
MTDIGFYIIENKYVKSISEEIPLLTYYLTKTIIKIKCESHRHTTFEPSFSLIEDTGHIRLAYVKFKLSKAKDDSEKMKAISACEPLFRGMYPEFDHIPSPIEFLIKKSMISHFANTQICINFMDKFIKNNRIYDEDTLSYLDPNYNKDFVDKYNIIIKNGLKKHTTKIKYDICIDDDYSQYLIDFYNEIINAYIPNFVISRQSQYTSNRQTYDVNKLISLTKEQKWNFRPIYFQYEFERLVDFFKIDINSTKLIIRELCQLSCITSSNPFLGDDNNNINHIIEEYKKISLSNSFINMTYIGNIDFNTNEMKCNITFQSRLVIIKLIYNMIKYYSKNCISDNLIISRMWITLFEKLNDLIFENKNFSNYSPGKPVNIEIPFINIPEKKETVSSVVNNEESNNESHYIYYEHETYR